MRLRPGKLSALSLQLSADRGKPFAVDFPGNKTKCPYYSFTAQASPAPGTSRLPSHAAYAPETSRLTQTSKSHSAPRPLEWAGARRESTMNNDVSGRPVRAKRVARTGGTSQCDVPMLGKLSLYLKTSEANKRSFIFLRPTLLGGNFFFGLHPFLFVWTKRNGWNTNEAHWKNKSMGGIPMDSYS